MWRNGFILHRKGEKEGFEAQRGRDGEGCVWGEERGVKGGREEGRVRRG